MLRTEANKKLIPVLNPRQGIIVDHMLFTQRATYKKQILSAFPADSMQRLFSNLLLLLLLLYI